MEASVSGIGVILSQHGHLIAYFSKKLSPRDQQQSVYAREMQAIVAVVTKFRHYLLGQKFTIRTDRRSSKKLQTQVIQTPEQQAWLAMIFQLNIK